MAQDRLQTSKSEKEPASSHEWRPVENICRRFGDLIGEFDRSFLRASFRGSRAGIEPLSRRDLRFVSAPHVRELNNGDCVSCAALQGTYSELSTSKWRMVWRRLTGVSQVSHQSSCRRHRVVGAGPCATFLTASKSSRPKMIALM